MGTYNQGVVLGGLAWLYAETGNVSLLGRGIAIANATIQTLVWPDGRPVLKESCEFGGGSNDCDQDQVQFKGIFVRHLMYFCQVLPTAFASEYNFFKSWIDTNVAAIWKSDRASMELGLTWTGPFVTAGAAVQTSATDALLARASLHRRGVSGIVYV